MHSNYKKLADQNIYLLPKVGVKRKIKKRKAAKKKKTAVRYKDEYSFIISSDFLKTQEWKVLRYQALVKHGKKCQCCGRQPKDGAVMNVDHIKPRLKYPELALSIDNLQVLCDWCNHGKGNKDQTDHRG